MRGFADINWSNLLEKQNKTVDPDSLIRILLTFYIKVYSTDIYRNNMVHFRSKTYSDRRKGFCSCILQGFVLSNLNLN